MGAGEGANDGGAGGAIPVAGRRVLTSGTPSLVRGWLRAPTASGTRLPPAEGLARGRLGTNSPGAGLRGAWRWMEEVE